MARSESGISRRKALQRGGIVIGGSVIGLSSVPTTAVAEPTEIDECGSYSDGEYVLTDDIDTTGDCFSLGPDTILDGNGHTISGDGTGAGISMGDATVQVRNLTVDNFDDGIDLSTLGDYTTDITIENTIISNNTSSGISGSYKPSISVRDSVIRDNNRGIISGEAARLSITQSTLSGNDEEAVSTTLGNFIEVKNSTIENNGAGIEAGEGTLSDNTITSNAGYGIQLIGLVAPTTIGDTTIIRNDIQDNSGAGIRFEGSNGVVRENIIEDNQNGVVISINDDYYAPTQLEEFEIINNNIEDNAEFGIRNAIGDMEDVDDEDVIIATATCNYWGDPTGPQHADNPNENPQGDKVSDDVEFIPWSVTEIQDGEGICLGGNPIGDFQSQPTDPDGDGLYEDINGDGESDIVDVQALFSNSDDETIQNNPEAFDFNGDGSVNVVDVQKLFNEVIK